MSTTPTGPLSGVVAAAGTPLREHGNRIDAAGVGRLVDHLAAGGVRGVFVAGTTGEGVLLTLEERMALTEGVRAAAGGRPAGRRPPRGRADHGRRRPAGRARSGRRSRRRGRDRPSLLRL